MGRGKRDGYEKGGIGRGRDGKGERRCGKWRECSTWIFVQGPRVPSYATACSLG